MATISAFTTLLPLTKIKFCAIPNSPPSVSVPIRSFGLKIDGFNNGFEHLKVKSVRELRKRRAVEEDTQLTEEGVATTSSSVAVEQEQPAVAVPVSPSDKLSMFFQAEGQMSDAAIPTVTNALEGTEGITNLKVDVSEGIASVELMKQTTIQATGVASSLVETIQGAGFKLQTLNLSFEEEEEVMV